MIYMLAIIAVMCSVIAGTLLEISSCLKRIAIHLESTEPEAPIDL
jgi:hypothetical protein